MSLFNLPEEMMPTKDATKAFTEMMSQPLSKAFDMPKVDYRALSKLMENPQALVMGSFYAPFFMPAAAYGVCGGMFEAFNKTMQPSSLLKDMKLAIPFVADAPMPSEPADAPMPKAKKATPVAKVSKPDENAVLAAKPVAGKKTVSLATTTLEARPSGLEAPRAGAADDLKMIAGVGEKIESTLHDLGIYHFDQIAEWTEKEVEWVDDYLSFSGRIAREDWISQAKALAKGGRDEYVRVFGKEPR